MFINTGDGELYLERVNLQCPLIGWSESKGIEKSIKRGEFCKADLIIAIKAGPFLSQTELTKRGGNLKDLITRGEVFPVFYDKDSSSLQIVYRSMGKDLMRVPAEAEAVAISARSGAPVLRRFECEVVFLVPRN